jgi:hypothetical protein
LLEIPGQRHQGEGAGKVVEAGNRESYHEIDKGGYESATPAPSCLAGGNNAVDGRGEQDVLIRDVEHYG